MPTKRPTTIELYKGKGTQPYRFRVKAANHEIILTAEGYSTSSNRLRAARKLASMLIGGAKIVKGKAK